MSPPTETSRVSTESEITLGVLTAIEQDSAVTQRSLARDLGIALGLANAYLKRCAKKGLVKVSQAPANRYAYYLTPAGFSEKSRLTAEYLSQSFNFFRAARRECTELMALSARRGRSRLALAGPGDLAEVAILCARDVAGVHLEAVLGGDAEQATFLGVPLLPGLDRAAAFPAVLVTDTRDPQGTFDALRGLVADEDLLTPRFLRISRTPPEGAP